MVVQKLFQMMITEGNHLKEYDPDENIPEENDQEEDYLKDDLKESITNLRKN